MIDLFQEMVDANPNDFKLGEEVRSLNKIFDHKHLQILCEKYPNNQMLGEEFRKFSNRLNDSMSFLRKNKIVVSNKIN
jgi:hypothetical protein